MMLCHFLSLANTQLRDAYCDKRKLEILFIDKAKQHCCHCLEAKAVEIPTIGKHTTEYACSASSEASLVAQEKVES